ncbi:MAG: hypothetical protein M3Y48_22120 [Actinomycetota bacterium]|nr:hypothetical protein [Actinomycetota bacterium]
MSDTLSFAELEAQQVELLPARTVLSLISLAKKPGPGANGSGAGGGMGGGAIQGLHFGEPNHFSGNSIHSGGTATGGAGGNANP